MPLVNVMVNARAYTIACDDGEEEHLKELAAHVDSKVRELLASVGQVGDQRLMLMAALLIADERHSAAASLARQAEELAALAAARDTITDRLDKAEGLAADALESAARRVEDIAARLQQA